LLGAKCQATENTFLKNIDYYTPNSSFLLIQIGAKDLYFFVTMFSFRLLSSEAAFFVFTKNVFTDFSP